MTNEIKYFIGEFSDLTGISKRMLRHYDRVGVFCPCAWDADNGYRFYDPSQVHDLSKVQYMIDLGFTLAQIKALQSKPLTQSDFLDMLRQREVALSQSADKLKSSLILVQRSIIHLQDQGGSTYSSITQLLDKEGSGVMAHRNTGDRRQKEAVVIHQRDGLNEKIIEVLALDQGDTYHYLTFDIDRFMAVNDDDGYAVGDAVIHHVSHEISGAFNGLIRRNASENFMGRMGGDEFSIFLKNAEPSEVKRTIEGLLEKVASYDYRLIGSSKAVTLSCGMAQGKKPVHVAQMMDLAIKGLLDAKRQGRDRYCIRTLHEG